MLAIRVLLHLLLRPRKSILKPFRFQLSVQDRDQFIHFPVCQVPLKSQQRIQRNPQQTRDRRQQRNVRQRIAPLPLIDRRRRHPETLRHFFLGHVFAFSVFSDDLSDLHIISSCLYHISSIFLFVMTV